MRRLEITTRIAADGILHLPLKVIIALALVTQLQLRHQGISED